MIVTFTFCALVAAQSEPGIELPCGAGSSDSERPHAIGAPYPESIEALKAWGIRFRGSPERLDRLRAELAPWLEREMNWNERVVELVLSDAGNALDMRMRSRPWETDALNVARRVELGIRDESLSFRSRAGIETTVPLVSRKEILASLLCRGRLTVFPAGCCSRAAVESHLELRQSIARWSLQSDWGFPDCGYSVFNPDVWSDDRCALPGISASQALADFYSGPRKYLIGCRTSCKVQTLQALFDHARRRDPLLLSQLELLAAGDPLADVEPRYGGSGDNEIVRQGRYVDAIECVVWNNWVAGDWGYVRNTDPRSRRENGNEGHNMIYLGRGLFAPNYRGEDSETERDRPLEKVLYSVYSWRGMARMRPESPALIRLLAEVPERGGLLEDQRFVPKVWPVAAADESIARTKP